MKKYILLFCLLFSNIFWGQIRNINQNIYSKKNNDWVVTSLSAKKEYNVNQDVITIKKV